MNKIIVVMICFLACSSGCVGEGVPIPSTAVVIATPHDTPFLSASPISSIIGDILSHPDQYSGKRVEIYGYFHGWDLLHETRQAPPVTRSDWVIADLSGAMYVTGSIPGGLSPSSPGVVWTVIHLSAIVEYNETKNVVYLKVETAEVVGK